MLEVLMPHYRDPAGLEASIASIAAQVWSGEICVIVVDDGSPEAEWNEVLRIADTAAVPVRLLRNPRNLGRPGSRNRLLSESRAPWLAWLDAGDVWYPDKLRVQFDYLAGLIAEGADPRRLWVSCAYDWDQNGHVRRVSQQVDGDQLSALLEGTRLRAYLWTLVGAAQSFRIAGRFDERLPRLQDLDYFANFVRGGGRIVVPRDGAPLCRYLKSDIGRAALEVRDSNHLVLDKLAPVIGRRGKAVEARLRMKAELLAARFAASNRQRGLQALCLARAAGFAPVEMAKTALRKVLQ